MIQPVDWTGIREITERSRQTPGHPMFQENSMKTGADYARTYRNKQREKVERYEAALREIAESQRNAGIYDTLGNAQIAQRALHIEV